MRLSARNKFRAQGDDINGGGEATGQKWPSCGAALRLVASDPPVEAASRSFGAGRGQPTVARVIKASERDPGGRPRLSRPASEISHG